LKNEWTRKNIALNPFTSNTFFLVEKRERERERKRKRKRKRKRETSQKESA